MTDRDGEREKAIRELVENVGKEDLAEQVLEQRSTLSKVPAEVMEFVDHHMSLMGCVKRNYKREIGLLKDYQFKPVKVTLIQADKERAPITREPLEEHRERTLEWSIVMGYDWIAKQEEIEKE